MELKIVVTQKDSISGIRWAIAYPFVVIACMLLGITSARKEE